MSTSVTSSASLRPWRVATIAVVGALAIGIGITLGSFLLNARASALGSAAGYVPAAAPFYVEIRVEPSADQDAALREFLGHFPPIEGLDLDRPLVDQMAERIDDAFEAGGIDASWSDDVATWFDGRLAITVLDVPEAHICCGSAGVYNILQPQLAGELRARKVANIESVRPDIVAAGNLGCITQIGLGTAVPIVHTVELLDWAYGGPVPKGLERFAGFVTDVPEPAAEDEVQAA